jgi:ribosomal-protein-alanine N-acetyltransferase
MIESPASIRDLTLEDLQRYGHYWSNAFDLVRVAEVITAFPGRSCWDRESLEVIIVGPWRHRDSVASVFGMQAVRAAKSLIRAAMDRAAALGDEALLALEWESHRKPAFYADVGLAMFDEVLPFERSLVDWRPDNRVSNLPIVTLLDATDIDELISVDQSAFSWLWINSRHEFEDYFANPSVVVAGHRMDGKLVSYVGTTAHGSWGHVDRVAVVPAYQRLGLGRDLMLAAMTRLKRDGASVVGLSTQAGNWKSQRLYRQLGFRQVNRNAYRVYGAYL